MKKLLWFLCITMLLSVSAYKPGCVNYSQAGQITVDMENSFQLWEQNYPKPFCSNPVVVVSWGANVDEIQVAPFSTELFGLEIYGTQGVDVTIYWIAMIPTK